jgi:multidrug resistance efflux pump
MTQAAAASTTSPGSSGTTVQRPRAERRRFWTWRRVVMGMALLPVAILAVLFLVTTTRWVYAAGYVMTDQEVELRSSVEGAIQTWLVKNGDRVTKNQLVMQLDDSVQRAAHEQAIAELQARQAKQQELLSTQKLDQAQRHEQIYQAKRSLALTQTNLHRLSQGNAYSNKEIENAQLRVELASSRLKELQISRDNVMDRQLQVLREQISSAQKNATLQEARLTMRQIRAPMAGSIYFNRFEPGEVVKSEHVLGQVFDREAWIIKLKVSERHIGHIQDDQFVEVRLAAYPKIQFGTLDAKVTRIWPVITPSPTGDGFFYIETAIQQQDRLPLQPGMSASAYISAGRTNWLYRLIGW